MRRSQFLEIWSNERQAFILAFICLRMDRTVARTWTCARCLRLFSPKLAARPTPPSAVRQEFHNLAANRAGQAAGRKEEEEDEAPDEEQGAMSRRLSEMAEETMDTGSKSDRKLIEQAGFSEDLKRQLEERITQTAFRAQHQQAFSESEMPVSSKSQLRRHA